MDMSIVGGRGVGGGVVTLEYSLL